MTVRMDKVKLDVHYETLCPDSIRFMLHQLILNYETIASMVQLNLIPFGKAEIYQYQDSSDVYCQHGPKECRGNILHSCALKEYEYNYTQVLPFIDCTMHKFFTNRRPDIDLISQNCANENHISWTKIESCATREGQQLLIDAGKKTKAVRPRITFIPTIVLNEKYSEAIQNKALYGDFVKLICSKYNGSSKPKECINAGTD